MAAQRVRIIVMFPPLIVDSYAQFVTVALIVVVNYTIIIKTLSQNQAGLRRARGLVASTASGNGWPVISSTQ
ncbi:unannotated protein [freshwater metagenome]|uniref:Unannotated protein n=1 Tax=freshwater metagenome TaxID=449393 RepID=A0A6J6YQL9_9ZZZZ